MTRTLLNNIAKAKKINLADYDSVMAYVNDNYTFVNVIFATAEVVGSTKRYLGKKTVKLSVASILKRAEAWPEEYETRNQNYQWLFDIK